MSRFLNIVENNLPNQNIDENRANLRELQQALSEKGIKSIPKTFKDVISIQVGNKMMDLELKNVYAVSEEEAEDGVISILGVPDEKLKQSPPILGAKKKVEGAFIKIADNFAKTAAKSTTSY